MAKKRQPKGRGNGKRVNPSRDSTAPRQDSPPLSPAEFKGPPRWLWPSAVVVVGMVIWWSVRAPDPNIPVTEPSTTARELSDDVATTRPTDSLPPSGASPTITASPLQPEGELPVTAKSWREIDNPAQDGWNSEAFSDQASLVLSRLGKMLVSAQPWDAKGLAEITTEQVVCFPLIPNATRTLFDDGALRVSAAHAEWEQSQPLEQPLPAAHDTGRDAFQSRLAEMMAPWKGATDLKFKFKMFRLQQLSAATTATRQYFSLSGKTNEGWQELHATWRIDWHSANRNAPQIAAVRCEAFETAQRLGAGERLFSDCTQSILGQDPSYAPQFLIGMNEWLERIQETRYFSTLGTPGLAVGDVNGDGLDDLFVGQEAGLPNRLFLQSTDGTARDVSQAWGVDWIDSSRGALLVDLDNDGDQDLAVATLGGIVVAENIEQQRFRQRIILPTDDDTMSLVAADYDQDADLDLYVCVDYPNDLFSDTQDISTIGGASNRVYHDANGAGRNSLYRNDIASAGDWKFTDVTKEVGLDENNRRFSLAASWEDFDDDGDQDLYVANDFGRNNLYRNDRESSGMAKFTDVAAAAGAEDSASGMSADWGDSDGDGLTDLYVGNMFSAAGGRITFQPEFQANSSSEVKARLQRFARGSTLLRYNRSGVFDDVSEQAGVTVGRWAWSSNFVDFNNDGWLDLLVANGYITADDTGDL